jgi:hypothetical protein
MDIGKYHKNIIVWIVPVILLLITLLPVALPWVYSLLLQIIVSLAAILIAYLHFSEKPKYYIPWGIVFIIILFIYNPLIHLNITMGIKVPLNLITAILFCANWFFIFRKR